MAATVDIRDEVSAAIKELRTSLVPARINPAIGAAEVRLFQNWFLSKPPNKYGWPSTGFWAGAARSTNYQALSAGVFISINQQGIRQRYYGGIIRPVSKKFLTIPARAEAYGRRAGEFDNLTVAFNRGGPFALVEAEAVEIGIGRKRKDGTRKITPGREIGGGVMFWLVKQVSQDGDPNVIPSDRLILATAMETIGDLADLALRRAGRG